VDQMTVKDADAFIRRFFWSSVVAYTFAAVVIVGFMYAYW
jgi:hypothetical protein